LSRTDPYILPVNRIGGVDRLDTQFESSSTDGCVFFPNIVGRFTTFGELAVVGSKQLSNTGDRSLLAESKADLPMKVSVF
jgi:hypothetical protein